MTLSNFNWTDKTSVKWFLMLPTGHEGPYSLDALIKRKTAPEMKVWAEGLSSPMTFKQVLAQYQNEEDEELPPPLPPLPVEDEFPAETIVDEPNTSETSTTQVPKFSKLQRYGGLAFAVALLLFFAAKQWVRTQEEFSIHRMEKMSPELYQKIVQDFKFDSWDKRIFFKEYVSVDMNHIWLITSSYQHCQIEAQFNSLKGKLLTLEDEDVAFKTSGTLNDHIVEFSRFEFINGNKVIPGLYEMDLKASHCKWDGFAAKLANNFTPSQSEYVTRMKVVLYHHGNVEFNANLDKLLRKKLDMVMKNQNQEELFWQDLQQKLQTLLAVSLQIEQLMMDFLDMDSRQFKPNLNTMVSKYTYNYGRFLTEFVVANEKYFQELEKSELSNMSKKRTYESMVKLTSKNLGFEAMKIIEEMQTFKNPKRKDLESFRGKIKPKFEIVKDAINRKIIQLTEDRAN